MVTVSPRPGVCLPSIREVEEAQAESEIQRRHDHKTLLSLQDFEKLLCAVSLQQSDLISRLSALKTCLKDNDDAPLKETPEKVRGKQGREVVEEEYSFLWGLEIVGHMPYPICKGKYFFVEVKAASLRGQELPREESVELEIVLLSSAIPAVEIRENMTGKPILKGQETALLKFSPSENCHCALFKVQITEVSSHFVNGWVHLTVRPKKSEHPEGQSEQIKPLVITNVIVRAKEKTCRKFRERERKGISQQRVKNLRHPPVKRSIQDSD